MYEEFGVLGLEVLIEVLPGVKKNCKRGTEKIDIEFLVRPSGTIYLLRINNTDKKSCQNFHWPTNFAVFAANLSI